MSLRSQILSVFPSLHPQMYWGKPFLMVIKWLPQFQTAYLYLKQKEVGRSTMFILTKAFLEHFSQLSLLSHRPKFCNVVLPSYEGTRKVLFRSVAQSGLTLCDPMN